jgi:hypothetical protein
MRKLLIVTLVLLLAGFFGGYKGWGADTPVVSQLVMVDEAQAHTPPCSEGVFMSYAYLDYHWHQCSWFAAAYASPCGYHYCWVDSGGCGYAICPQRVIDPADPTSFRLEGL